MRTNLHYLVVDSQGSHVFFLNSLSLHYANLAPIYTNNLQNRFF